MSSRTRNYVRPNGEMYRVAAYDNETGKCVASFGPYATRAPAMAGRRQLARRPGRRVLVEVCHPTWEPVPGTEVAGG